HHKVEGLTPEAVTTAHQQDVAVQARYGVRFIRYWYDERRGKVFCLSEAPTSEAVAAVHRAAHGLIADEVVEVSEGVYGYWSSLRPLRTANRAAWVRSCRPSLPRRLETWPLTVRSLTTSERAISLLLRPSASRRRTSRSRSVSWAPASGLRGLVTCCISRLATSGWSWAWPARAPRMALARSV